MYHCGVIFSFCYLLIFLLGALVVFVAVGFFDDRDSFVDG